jgi:arsenate reductase-like glutaredoxin family protein
LRRLLRRVSPAAAFAWRSPRAKALHLDPASPPPGDRLVRLMLDVPYLLKRPVIEMGERVVFGFDRRALEELTSAA